MSENTDITLDPRWKDWEALVATNSHIALSAQDISIMVTALLLTQNAVLRLLTEEHKRYDRNVSLETAASIINNASNGLAELLLRIAQRESAGTSHD